MLSKLIEAVRCCLGTLKNVLHFVQLVMNKAIHQIAHCHTTIKQTYKILCPYKCRQPKPQTTRQYSPIMATPMYMSHHTMHMLSQTQMRRIMHIRCPHQQPNPLMPTPPNVIQFIEFTYCHDRFPNTTHSEKTTKYNPLIKTLRAAGWQVNPLITITAGVRGAIHEQSIEDPEKLKIPKSKIKILMKHLHEIAIKYLTYLIINKRKLDNKQSPVDPPLLGGK